eukprot:255923-Amorphochlora_amoeboformis.AAC.1
MLRAREFSNLDIYPDKRPTESTGKRSSHDFSLQRDSLGINPTPDPKAQLPNPSIILTQAQSLSTKT